MQVRKRKVVRVLLLAFVFCSFLSMNVYAADDSANVYTANKTDIRSTGIAFEDLVLADAPAKTLVTSYTIAKADTSNIIPKRDPSLHEEDTEVVKEEAEAEETEEPQKIEEPVEELPYFGSDGLLVEEATDQAQEVINLLMYIPGHCNGASYHASTGLDEMIDELSVEECVYVIHRIEGAGFGQTGAGYAGYDTPESHQNFLNEQVIERFGGSIKDLLKHWGTYEYGGY